MEAFRDVGIGCQCGLDKLDKLIRNQDLSSFGDYQYDFFPSPPSFAVRNLAKVAQQTNSLSLKERLKEFGVVGSFTPKKTFFHDSGISVCRGREISEAF